MKNRVLKWFLILSGSIQICYWGISHVFFPQWYLRSVGLTSLADNPGTTVIFLNEIGILTISMGIATIIASFNPVQNIAVIFALYIAGIGSVGVSLYHIISGSMVAGEWITVIIIAVQIVLLSVLFPWSELHRNKKGQ